MSHHNNLHAPEPRGAFIQNKRKDGGTRANVMQYVTSPPPWAPDTGGAAGRLASPSWASSLLLPTETCTNHLWSQSKDCKPRARAGWHLKLAFQSQQTPAGSHGRFMRPWPNQGGVQTESIAFQPTGLAGPLNEPQAA